MKVVDFKKALSGGQFNNTLISLYGGNALSVQTARYIKAVETFEALFPEKDDVRMFSASGRTEIGGNHTDHQRGAILAGAVNLDIIGVVAFNESSHVRVKSEGYDLIEISLESLNKEDCDSGTALIIKGIISEFAKMGVGICGFDLYCTSDVICGGGISSSAAFEMLVATIINIKYNNNKSTPFELAKIGQYAENVFFGKKCGLLDQTVSSYGGLVSIDFKDSENPIVEKLQFDFEKAGYALCITDTKSSHESLSHEYDAIFYEMRLVSEYFGCEVLSEVNVDEFYPSIPNLREHTSERAVLRAMHFFDETKRAIDEAEALKKGDVDRFISLVNESGLSSALLLQNLFSGSTPLNQEIPLAIALSKKVLGGRGAVRVHGGGFAGTIQAFVPMDLLDIYKKTMDSIFGENSCMQLRIRPIGGTEITF